MAGSRNEGLRLVADAVDRVLRVVSLTLAVLASIITVVLISAMVVNMLFRNLGGLSVAALVEGTEVLIVFIAVLGAPYALREGAHVSTTVLTDRVPESVSRVLVGLGSLLGVVFLLVMSYATVSRAYTSVMANEIRFGIVSIPAWPARVALGVGFTILLLEMLNAVVRRVITGQEVAPLHAEEMVA